MKEPHSPDGTRGVKDMKDAMDRTSHEAWRA